MIHKVQKKSNLGVQKWQKSNLTAHNLSVQSAYSTIGENPKPTILIWFHFRIEFLNSLTVRYGIILGLYEFFDPRSENLLRHSGLLVSSKKIKFSVWVSLKR